MVRTTGAAFLDFHAVAVQCELFDHATHSLRLLFAHIFFLN
jgi:hypothetical protein